MGPAIEAGQCAWITCITSPFLFGRLVQSGYVARFLAAHPDVTGILKSDNAYADIHGITLYHVGKPTEKDSNYSYYRSTLDFALTTGWDEFLRAYAR